MADNTTPPPAPGAPQMEALTLGEPIKRGEQQLDTIHVRKPKSGELRGLSLQDLLRADITSLLQLVPRVTVPPLTSVEADNLGPDDLAQFGGIIRDFFMTTSERKMLMAVLEEYAPKT